MKSKIKLMEIEINGGVHINEAKIEAISTSQKFRCNVMFEFNCKKNVVFYEDVLKMLESI